MYICVCKAITEGDIRAAAQQGCRTVKQLSRELGLGTECGLCVGCAHQCLKEATPTVPADKATAA